MRSRRNAIVLAAGALLTAVALFSLGCGACPEYTRLTVSGEIRSRWEAHYPNDLATEEPGRAGLRGEYESTGGGFDELWIIELPDEERRGGQRPAGDVPTCGQLRALVDEKEIPLPLEKTEVSARVSAFVASVDVVQKYRNPYATKIEAVYLFPLPQDAAVTDFVMSIGNRHIRGVIRERTEARRIYENAKRQGHVASILTQERPNVFTQRVANIEPGKRIDVQISYFNPLRYADGDYEFVFPMVVGPRFNPSGHRGGVGAAGRGERGASSQDTEVEYLKPGERSGHEISLKLAIDAGVEIEDVSSPSHTVRIARPAPSQAIVELAPNDRIPNRDFVLRYRTAGKKLKSALLVHREEEGGTFALFLQPPREIKFLPRTPREMVFVVDCSGSMNGWPMDKAKEAMRRCLAGLDPADTFQIIRFSDQASTLGAAPLAATGENVRRGQEYVEGLSASGGTMMMRGLKAALDFPRDERRLRVVSFMTDGYIGNENEILAEVERKIGSARIFSFGVGDSVNRYLLERMAKLGRGAAAFLGSGDSAGRKVDEFYEHAAHPALTDVEVDWGGMKVSDVYPREIPDLFVGRPVLITGRFTGGGRRAVRVSGRSGGEETSFAVEADLDESGHHAGLDRLWARWRIMDLSERELTSPSAEIRREMLAASLRHSVLCRYTAFLAVDGMRKTSGDHGVTVKVPVPVPEGVRYETTVNE